MLNNENLVGQKFSRLEVIALYSTEIKSKRWLCKCDCGNETLLSSACLTTGNTKSCGCLRCSLLSRRHGFSRHPIYPTWMSMISRCTNPKNDSFNHYGGRGIIICKQWRNSIEEFYNWAINNGWQKGLEIDRIENNGNYTPENCRFVTRQMNMNNTRSNIVISYQGRTQTLIQWSRELNLKYPTLVKRFNKRKDINSEDLFRSKRKTA